MLKKEAENTRFHYIKTTSDDSMRAEKQHKRELDEQTIENWADQKNNSSTSIILSEFFFVPTTSVPFES